MSMDYSSSAFAVAKRSKPVSIIGTVPVSGTVTITPSGTQTVTFSSQSIALTASATVGTAASLTRLIGLTNAAQTIKGTAGRLFGCVVANPGAAAVYVNIYNVVAPVIGTTQPNLQVLIPAGQSFAFELPAVGVAFGTAITMACTDISVPLSAVAPATTVQASVFWI